MTRRASPTVKRRRVAGTLKMLRERTGMTVADAARAVDHDQSWLSRIEGLESGIHPNDCRALLAIYGVTGDVAEAIVAVSRAARQRGWWASYRDILPDWFASFVGLESEASAIRAYEAQAVPGLLQTEDYARATFLADVTPRHPDEIARRVALRMDRQALLDSDDAPRLMVVLDEAVLRRVVGGPQTMRAQVERLLGASTQPHIRIQVLPFDAGAHAGLDGSFTILDFPPPPEPYPRSANDRIVYIDSLTAALYLEQPTEVAAYAGVFEQVRAEALSTERSRDLLSAVIKELTR